MSFHSLRTFERRALAGLNLLGRSKFGTMLLLLPARVAKLADARDLKSRVSKETYRFDSGPGHHASRH
jgi:hypothetical protein